MNESVSEASVNSSPRLDLREQHLPWAHLSISLNADRHKSQLRALVAGVVSSKGASSFIGQDIHRVAIAVKCADWRPGAGDVGRRVARGGAAIRGRHVAASRASGIGGGFRWLFCRNARSFPSRRNHLRPIARASAQPQFPKNFRCGCASGPVATRCSSSRRTSRPGVSVVACAVELCAMCSIAKRGIGVGGERGFGRVAGVLDRRRDSGCDVFRGGRRRFRRYDSHTPKAKATGGSVFSGPPFLPMDGVLGRMRPCACGRISRPDRCR